MRSRSLLSPNRVDRVSKIVEILAERRIIPGLTDNVIDDIRCSGRERCNRSNRVHDLVCQHANEVLPGLGLGDVELALYVLQ